MATLNSTIIMINGCTGSLDKLNRKIEDSTSKMLKAVGVANKYGSKMEKTMSKILKASAGEEKYSKKLDKKTDKMLKAMTSEEKYSKKLDKTATKILKASNSEAKYMKKLDGTASKIMKMISCQEKYNKTIQATEKSAEKSGSKIGGMVKSVFSLGNAQKGMAIVDDFANTNQRLGLVNQGKTANKGESQGQLQDKVFAAANRSRGSYGDMAGTVADLGLTASQSFGNNDEIIGFAELSQKSVKLGGASPEDQSSTTSTLTQAMSTGSLDSGGFDTILKNAPMIAEAISKYTGMSTEELIKMSEAGGISADILKNSMFAASGEINDNFSNLPMTFADIWGRIQNGGLQAFGQIMDKITELISNPGFQSFIDGIVNGFGLIAIVAGGIIGVITEIGALFCDNWSWIAPIVMGIVAALAIYNAISLITNGILAAQAAMKGIAAMATAAQTSTTFLATVSQQGLNAALYACPITWIILAIIALIAIFYAVVAAINHFAGTSISATGLIIGAFAAVGAVIYDLFLGILELAFGVINALVNPFILFGNFLANVFTSPISSIVYLFQGMADGVLGTLEKIASAMDLVFGTNMAATVGGWRADLKTMADNIVEKYAPGEDYENKVDPLNLSVGGLGLGGINPKDAYNAGNAKGHELDDKVSSLTDSLTGNGEDKKDDKYKPNPYDNKNPITNPNAAPTDLGTASNPTTVQGSGPNGSVEVGMSDSEDLQYLRDLAERDYIAKVATNTLAPNVMIQFGDVHKTADSDQVAGRIRKILQEEIAMTAEGGY